MFFKNKIKEIKQNILKINKTTQIYNYTIPITQNHKIKNLKILHLSDTHFSKLKNEKLKNKKLFNKLKKETFDIIIHTGDIIDNYLNEFSKENRNHLKELKAKYGKFYVNGNHEYLNNEKKEIENLMKKLNFENISNKIKKITLNNNKEKTNNNNKQINLIGIDPLSKENLNGLKINKNEFNILLTHNLDLIKKEKIPLFDFILSGHLHSGEINLGIISGITFLKLKNQFKNKYNQIKKFKKLNQTTISFIHPGMHTHITTKFKLPRILTQKEGAVIIKFK